MSLFTRQGYGRTLLLTAVMVGIAAGAVVGQVELVNSMGSNDPILSKIFVKRGQPDFTKQIKNYILPGALPSTAQAYVEPEDFVIVTAGAKLPLVSKLFSEKTASKESWLKELENPLLVTERNRWAWSFVPGSPTNAGLTGTVSALSGTSGDSVLFTSTVAHQQYRVRVTYTSQAAGVAQVTQEIIISVVPDIRTPNVSIESNWQMTTANQNKSQKVSELAFATWETEKGVYAILRDQYGNYITPSGASIPIAYGPPGVTVTTIKTPGWTPLQTQSVSNIVYAVNGQVSQGQGNVYTTGTPGKEVYVVVTDNTFGKKDSVLARLLNYYYEDIQIVVQCAQTNIGVKDYCSPPNGIIMDTNEEEKIFVIGKCSGTTNCDGKGTSGWELVSGDWDRDNGLTNALTTLPSGTNNWTLTPSSTGEGEVTVTRPGPNGTTLADAIHVKITAGLPTRAEIKIITPPEQRIAGQPIKFEITYFNTTVEMKDWNHSWTNNGANIADLLVGLGLTNVNPTIVSDKNGKQELFYRGNLGTGKVNAKLSHDLVNGKDIVTITIYNATDNPHQIKYMETVEGTKQEAVSEPFRVLPGDPAKVQIVGPDGNPIDNLVVHFKDPDRIYRVVAVDEWGNKVDDYPSDWRADKPVDVNIPNRPIIVYSPGNATENSCGWLVVTGTANTSLKDSVYICMTNVSIVSSDFIIPTVRPTNEITSIASVKSLSAEFTAGPNPAGKSFGGAVNFFRTGAAIKSAKLHIYDASGNVVCKVAIKDSAVAGNNVKRSVGSWDLRDNKGRPVAEGTYLVRGVVKTKDGKSEKVSLVVGVR